MPRRRTSNRPLRRRIKLNTQQDVQSELGKVYRSVDAGNMSPAEGTRRVFMLDKLRASGLPDARQSRWRLCCPRYQRFFGPVWIFSFERADRSHEARRADHRHQSMHAVRARAATANAGSE